LPGDDAPPQLVGDQFTRLGYPDGVEPAHASYRGERSSTVASLTPESTAPMVARCCCQKSRARSASPLSIRRITVAWLMRGLTATATVWSTPPDAGTRLMCWSTIGVISDR